MSTKLHVHDAPEHYGEEYEAPRRPIAKDGANNWIWIAGVVVLCFAILGLVRALVRLSLEKKREKRFSFF